MESFKRFKDFMQDIVFPIKHRTYNGIFSVMICPDVINFAYVKNNYGIIELQATDSISYKPTELKSTLASLVNKYALESVACSWLLTPDKYQLIQIEELPVPTEEFQSAVRWQIKKLLSFPIDDAFIDRYSIPPSQIANPKKMIQIVAAQASYIQPTANILLESGLNLTVIDIQELALRNITALYENDDKASALIYLQEKNSIITITRQKLFYFTRKLNWSLETLSKASDVEQAHEYFDKLALELHRSFDYFQAQWRYPAPVRIFVATSIPTSFDIATYLSQRLSLSIQNLNLNTVMRSKITLDLKTQGRYLPLIGAALRDEKSYATTS